MFKNAIVYRFLPGWAPSIESLEEALGKNTFAPVGATQERSSGWVPPRGEQNGPLVESVAGALILAYQTESKAVPGSVVKRKLEEKVAQIEKSTGRKPGRKESKELKEDVLLELLPMAFTKMSRTVLWIDRDAGRLVIDTAGQGRADEMVSALVEAAGSGLALSLLNTNSTAVASMAEWLVSQEPPAGFSVDRELELKAADESKSVVRYGRHALDIDEVREHIAQGKLPTRLAMTWDERVSFVLTEGLTIRKIEFLEGVFDGTSGQKEDGFDADVAIATGELAKLLPDLIEALGAEPPLGELRPASHDPGGADGDPDPLYDQAVALVHEHRRASISLVQRYLQIGYNRAARLLEAMEVAGVVSPMRGDGGRDILKAAA